MTTSEIEALCAEAEALDKAASEAPWVSTKRMLGIAGKLAASFTFATEADTEFCARARTLLPALAAACRELADRPDCDLYEKSMNAIHEAAGIRRDGLCGILGWIEDAKEARRALEARKP